MKPLNVAYLIPYAEPGGGERIMFELMRRMDPAVICPRVILPMEGTFAQMLRDIGISVAIIPFSRSVLGGYPPGISFRAYRGIRRQLMEWSADLLHVNDSYLMLLGGLAARSANIPVGLTAHGTWDAHFVLQDVLNRWFADRVWAASETIAAAMGRRKLLPSGRLHTVRFGVDIQRFKPTNDKALAKERLDLPPAAFVVTRVARFDHAKDYPTFLKAMDKVLTENPQIHVLIAGDTLLDIPSEPRSYKEESVRFVQERSHLRQRVHFLGQRKDVENILSASDILVSSSLSEGAPVNILEAMAAGVPIVTTPVGSIPEMVSEECAQFSPVGEFATLAQNVMALSANDERRARMSKAGRERAEKFFSLDAFARTMQGEYVSLAKKRPAGSCAAGLFG